MIQDLFELNQAAVDGDMTLGQRVRWLALMLVLGALMLAALWLCR